MNPNRTLENIRSLIEAAHHDGTVIYEDGGWLFEMVESLDGWLSNGGFLPEDWTTDTVKRQMED